MRYFYFLVLLFCLGACQLELQEGAGQELEQQDRSAQADEPAKRSILKKDFDYEDLEFKGQALRMTKHGRCRSACRHIDAYEIQEILEKGKINYKKTRPNDQPCPSFAYEGISRDGQKLRVVIGACETDPRVITVIDLGKKWSCSCK